MKATRPPSDDPDGGLLRMRCRGDKCIDMMDGTAYNINEWCFEGCNYVYKYVADSKHIRECATCGNTKGFLMSCMYENGICSSCGNRQPTSQNRVVIEQIIQ